MSVLLTARMETNLSEWSSETDPAPGYLAWSEDATAKLVAGSAGAMMISPPGGATLDARYCQKTVSSTAGKIRGRFYIDTNSLTMANADEFNIHTCYGTAGALVVFVLKYTTAGGYAIVHGMWNDTPAFVSYESAITDAPHIVEYYLQRAATDVSADGSLLVWVDGVAKTSVTAQDNYHRLADFTFLRAGAHANLDAGTVGTFYLDEFVINDDGGLIGPITRSIDAHEDIAIAEDVTLEVGEAPTGDLSVNVTDAIVLSEAKTVSVTPHPTLTVNVHEDIGAAESKSASVSTSTVDAHEDIGVALSFGVAVPISEVNKSESIGHTESIGAEVSTSQVDVHEDIATSESATVALATVAYVVNVSDGVNVWEPPFYGFTDLEISVTDNILVEETQDLYVPIGRDVFVEDTVYVIDPPFQFASDLSVNVHEDIGITESVTASIQAASSLSLSVSSNITVSSPAPGIFVYPIVELYIELDDQISTTEFVDGSYPLGIAITPDSVFAPGIRIRA